MSYIRGCDREQVQLLPACVEDYVPADSPVRFIEAFVETLDVAKLGFERAEPAGTGRPGYDPRDMLRLYLYGYLNRIRSSRRLEAEAGRNLELMWLLQGLRHDFKTIADFRRDHRSCFKSVLREFNVLCRKLDLFGAELVAIDGAKFKAVNSPKRHYTAGHLAEMIAKIDERIESYLGELDEQDTAAEGVPPPPDRAGLQEKIAQLSERRDRYDGYQKALAQTGASELSLTDPDSRGQKKVRVGYNVQVAVDNKHDLIAAEEVVQDANDLAQLAPMARAASEAIGVSNAVADAGYHEAGQLQQCEQAGLETYVPAPGTRSGQANGGGSVYPKERFDYDAQKDCYGCPAGHELPRAGQGRKNGKDRFYYYNMAACRDCALKAQCTGAAYRKLSRLQNEAVVERQAGRVNDSPAIVAERKEIVEHVFGTLRMWGHDTFLCRGLEMVRAEFSLSALAYNLRRVLNVLGIDKLLEAVRHAA
jgi:transposase